jgi:hypothetical protein
VHQARDASIGRGAIVLLGYQLALAFDGSRSGGVVRGPSRRTFVRVQRNLGSNDALNEYIKHLGSGLWAIAPGARRGGWVGESLLGTI